MKREWTRVPLGAVGTLVLCFWCAALARGQANPAPQEQKPLLAEQVFKNIQVLRGVPANQFLATMGFFSASLGSNCTFCHVEESGGNWAKYADDNAKKQTARKMILMMNAINQSYFGGKRALTCYSCHRGGETPKVIPDLAAQYSTIPLSDDPDEILEQAPDAPSPDQILNKYVQALGGATKLAAITSIVAKGTYKGYDDTDASPAEIYAKAPGQRAVIVHGASGDSITTFDGNSGWTAAPDTDTPIPLLALTGPFLDAARLDAELSFPARIKQTLSQWRSGYPSTIGDRDVQIVQGTSAGGAPVKLYFDSQSGLLVRLVRYAELPVGQNPTQIDYADYRTVGNTGVKMPFRWTVTWTDGRGVTQLRQVQTNVAIDAARFGKPSSQAPGRAGSR
jgi:photosynthetic reaction center cytochrome c subunit